MTTYDFSIKSVFCWNRMKGFLKNLLRVSQVGGGGSATWDTGQNMGCVLMSLP